MEDPVDFSRQIQKMFDAVAPRYDFLNCVLSLGQDRYWRKSAVRLLQPDKGAVFLDVATGTADIALEIASQAAAKEVRIFGVDFSASMLEQGKKKVLARRLDKTIHLQRGCGENLPFADACFDGGICAFGIRNFSDTRRGLAEMFRVLKTNGRIVILEFSYPRVPLLRGLYKIYFEYCLPVLGRFVSGHRNAYKYLPESVSRFPVRSDFMQIMKQAGFADIIFKDLTFGIVTVYLGFKHA